MDDKDVEDDVMTRKIIMVLIAGLFAAALPATVLAGGPEYSGYDSIDSRMSAESARTVDADVWPVSGPVETGAVPGDLGSDKILPSDSHFNPFHPELRTIDGGGGGE